jgi:8-oxo-dGTP pyrophosphatase MutT (NUDIX family)
MKRGRYRKAVFIVVYRLDKKRIFYLLLKRKLHWKGWEFPKGGVERFEFSKRAVKREVREETGQKPVSKTVKRYNIKGNYKYDKKYADRPGFIGQTYRLFSAEILNKKIKISKKEHSTYKWLDFKNALKKLKWLNQKKCLRIVNKELENENKHNRKN